MSKQKDIMTQISELQASVEKGKDTEHAANAFTRALFNRSVDSIRKLIAEDEKRHSGGAGKAALSSAGTASSLTEEDLD